MACKSRLPMLPMLVFLLLLLLALPCTRAGVRERVHRNREVARVMEAGVWPQCNNHCWPKGMWVGGDLSHKAYSLDAKMATECKAYAVPPHTM